MGKIKISFPDGAVREYDKGIHTVEIEKVLVKV